MQRIFKHSDIQYITLTPDKILNSLVYRTLFCVNIYVRFKFSKNSPVIFGPPCIYSPHDIYITAEVKSFKVGAWIDHKGYYPKISKLGQVSVWSSYVT